MTENNTHRSSRQRPAQQTRSRWYLGRVSRLGFVFGLLYAMTIFLAYAGLMLAATFVVGMSSSLSDDVARTVLNGTDAFLLTLAKILFGVVVATLAIRRLHDVEFSGWVLLLIFVPLVNLALIGCLLLAPSKEPNKYGLPLRSLRFWTVLGFK